MQCSIYRSSRLEVFFKEGVLRNFAKFTGKHLSCGVFLRILQNFYSKVLIDKLRNRFNMFTEESFAIYVLDDYSVHLMPEVREALLKKGYVLAIIGGGIAGDIQIRYSNQ